MYQNPQEPAERRRLDSMFEQVARAALADGVPIDCAPGCELARWVVEHVKIRPGTLFFAVFIIAGTMDRIERKERGE